MTNRKLSSRRVVHFQVNEASQILTKVNQILVCLLRHRLRFEPCVLPDRVAVKRFQCADLWLSYLSRARASASSQSRIKLLTVKEVLVSNWSFGNGPG